MSFPQRIKKTLYLIGFCAVLTTAVHAQNYVVPSDGEFSILGPQNGDQIHPALSLTPQDGVIVWEDNVIDHVGSGIGLRRFIDNNSFATSTSSLQVNGVATLNQCFPAAAILTNRMTLVVWESNIGGTHDIYGRVFNPKNVHVTPDFRINAYLPDGQTQPAVAALNDGTAVVVWQSAWQDGCRSCIIGRKIGWTGQMSPKEFKANQYNDNTYTRGQRGGRRSPSVAALANGNFVVTWVTERQNRTNIDSVEIYGRVFARNCTPVTSEFRISPATHNPCANPSVAALTDGGFMVAWSQRDMIQRTNSWDIMGRAFEPNGTPRSNVFPINGFTFGDQYCPKLAACPSGVLAVWTSMGEDGDREGVFGRFVLNGTQTAGDEFMVNTTRVSKQIQPQVAWNGLDRFLVIWTSFSGRPGFDLYGQAYTLNATP
jgi:hypothetical protein